MPNDAPVARRPETERIPAPQSAYGRQRATRARRDGLVRRRLVVASALLIPLVVAGGSWYVLLGGRNRGGVRADSTDVTLSAGAVALDTTRASGSAATGSSARRPASPASNPPTPTAPTPRSADSKLAARASPGTAAPGTGVSRRDAVGGATISQRCRSSEMADQRACMQAYVAVNDVSLRSAYDSLIVELRRAAPPGRRTIELPEVRQLRVEQRSWLADRDRECSRQVPPDSVALWARPLAECFARAAAVREGELQSARDRARGRSR